MCVRVLIFWNVKSYIYTFEVVPLTISPCRERGSKENSTSDSSQFHHFNTAHTYMLKQRGKLQGLGLLVESPPLLLLTLRSLEAVPGVSVEPILYGRTGLM